MANKKTNLRNKINKKSNTKTTNKSSISNKTTKQNNTKYKRNVKKVQVRNKTVKNELTTQKQEEIKQIDIQDEQKQENINIENNKINKQIKVKKAKTEKKSNLKEEKRQKIKTKNKKIKKAKTKNKKTTIKATLKKLVQFLKKRKYYVLSFIITVILITVLLIVLPSSDEKIFFSFKEYKIGEKVTLNDNSTWYIVEDSSSEKSKVTLLSETLLDINKDKKIDNKDKIVYDKDNKCIYDTKKENNIGYFLENDVKKLLKEINGISEIRLLTSEEYISIRKAMGFGYDWKEGNWLASDSLNSWWLETSKYNKIYTVTKRGSYKLSEAKSKNYVRPVIKVDKSTIK